MMQKILCIGLKKCYFHYEMQKVVFDCSLLFPWI
jgi:hypothetical protein